MVQVTSLIPIRVCLWVILSWDVRLNTLFATIATSKLDILHSGSHCVEFTINDGPYDTTSLFDYEIHSHFPKYPFTVTTYSVVKLLGRTLLFSTLCLTNKSKIDRGNLSRILSENFINAYVTFFILLYQTVADP